VPILIASSGEQLIRMGEGYNEEMPEFGKKSQRRRKVFIYL